MANSVQVQDDGGLKILYALVAQLNNLVADVSNLVTAVETSSTTVPAQESASIKLFH